MCNGHCVMQSGVSVTSSTINLLLILLRTCSLQHKYSVIMEVNISCCRPEVSYFEVTYSHWNFSCLFSILSENREVKLLSKRSRLHTLPAITVSQNKNIHHTPYKPLSISISLLGALTFLYHILILVVSAIPIAFSI
jgi:hypothetical protein